MLAILVIATTTTTICNQYKRANLIRKTRTIEVTVVLEIPHLHVRKNETVHIRITTAS